jgi:hypothetical protein
MSRPLYPKTWDTEYVCSSCGYHAPVHFVDPAAFAEDEPVDGRDKWAQQAALAAAQTRLEKIGRRAMRLLRCPSCQRRDAQANRRAYLWAALPLLGAVPAMFIIALIITAQLARRHDMSPGPGIWAALTTVLLSGVVLLRGHHRLLKEASAAVQFGKGEKQPAGPEGEGPA